MAQILTLDSRQAKRSVLIVGLVMAFAFCSFGESITSVSAVTDQETQTITILGSGFGTHSPYTGDSSYLDIGDHTKDWAAGCVGCQVTLVVDSWTDTTIVLGGFAGAWGAPNPLNPGTTWTLSPGDVLHINVWDPANPPSPVTITTTVGAVPEPGSLAMLGGGTLAFFTMLWFRRRQAFLVGPQFQED